MKKQKDQIKLYLSLIFLTAVVILVTAAFLLININKFGLLTSILIVLLVVLTIILLKLQDKLNYLKHEHTLLSLLENKVGPVSSFIDIHHNDFVKRLTNDLSYQHFRSMRDFNLFYKVAEGVTKRKKNSILYAVLIYKNNESFVNSDADRMFESLEKKIYKEEKYKHRIFFQFKQTSNDYTEEDITDTDKIFFISQRRENIILINVLQSFKTKQVYFLHSKNTRLPAYFEAAYKEIEKII